MQCQHVFLLQSPLKTIQFKGNLSKQSTESSFSLTNGNIYEGLWIVAIADIAVVFKSKVNDFLEISSNLVTGQKNSNPGKSSSFNPILAKVHLKGEINDKHLICPPYNWFTVDSPSQNAHLYFSLKGDVDIEITLHYRRMQ
jgi:hypothetical protein